jgi:hypothetical protein
MPAACECAIPHTHDNGGGRGKRLTYDEAAVTALLDSARATLSEDGNTWEAPAGAEPEADAEAGGLGSLRPQMWVFDDADAPEAAAEGDDGEEDGDGGDGGGAPAEAAPDAGGEEVPPGGESGDYWESLLASRHAALRAREEADAELTAAPRLRERRRPATYVFEDEEEAERRRKRARAGEASALAACDGWGLGPDAPADWEAAEEAAEERRRRKRERRERAAKGSSGAANAAAAQRRLIAAAFASAALAHFDPLLDARPAVMRAVAELQLPPDVTEVALELAKYLILEEPVASRNAAFQQPTLVALVLIAADTFGAPIAPEARTPAALSALFGQPPESVSSYCALVYAKVQRRMAIVAGTVVGAQAGVQQQAAADARAVGLLLSNAHAEAASREEAAAAAALAAAPFGSAQAAAAEQALLEARARHAATAALLAQQQNVLATEAENSLQGALRIAHGLRRTAMLHRAIAQAAAAAAPAAQPAHVGVAG